MSQKDTYVCRCPFRSVRVEAIFFVLNMIIIILESMLLFVGFLLVFVVFFELAYGQSNMGPGPSGFSGSLTVSGPGGAQHCGGPWPGTHGNRKPAGVGLLSVGVST